jgi:hypothetical protein
LHTNAAAVGTAANSTLICDGEGHEDAVFILQVGGALSLGAGVQMALINGAQAQNVFWKVRVTARLVPIPRSLEQ